MESVRAFALSFWRSMGDPNTLFTALRQAAIAFGVVLYFLALMALAQTLD